MAQNYAGILITAIEIISKSLSFLTIFILVVTTSIITIFSIVCLFSLVTDISKNAQSENVKLGWTVAY